MAVRRRGDSAHSTLKRTSLQLRWRPLNHLPLGRQSSGSDPPQCRWVPRCQQDLAEKGRSTHQAPGETKEGISHENLHGAACRLSCHPIVGLVLRCRRRPGRALALRLKPDRCLRSGKPRHRSGPGLRARQARRGPHAGLAIRRDSQRPGAAVGSGAGH